MVPQQRPRPLDTGFDDPWRVRVRHPNGRIVGAGVLIDSRRVLTCAHVVALATGTDPGGSSPDGVVLVDFPSVSGLHRTARVTSDGWVPVAVDGRGDLAVLALVQPVPSELVPASLLPCGRPDDRHIHAYGHPADISEGVWARTRMAGVGGPGGEWIQIDGLTDTGRRVERGFSGAGAVDVTGGRSVVGLVVAEDLEAANRVAWMIPMELVTRYLPLVSLGGEPEKPDVPTGGGRERDPFPPVAGAVERRLSVPEWRELFKRVWAVPQMGERSVRDLYIRAMERQLGSRLIVNRQTDDALDVWALLYALYERSDAIRELVRVLVGIHPDDTAVGQLEEFVERTFPDHLLQHDERVALETLLVGAAWTTVGAAYRQATAAMQMAPSLEGSDIVTVVRQLEAFGRLRGGPPPAVVVFAEEFAHKIGGRTSTQLHRWIDGVAVRLDLDRRALHQACEQADRRRDEVGQVSFVVALQADKVDENRYLMSAWVQQGELPERPILRDDVLRTLPQVAETVDDLLAGVPETVDFDQLLVELIVPRRLLALPVDEWESDRNSFPRPLGIRYPVVARSLERMSKGSAGDVWRRKSRWLRDNGHQSDSAAIYCLTGRPASDIETLALYSTLALEDHLVCLAVPFPPSEGEHARQDVFAAAIAAGVPVIVWSRESTDPQDFGTLVRDVLASDGLRNLPGRLLWHRRNAMRLVDSEPRRQVASRVGLLQDIADRIPGQFKVRLRAPR